MASELNIRSFSVDVPVSEVERLHRKLVDTRLPLLPILPDAGDDYGFSFSALNRLYQKWIDHDWVAVQRHLNRHKHFIATVDDGDDEMEIHFTHTRSFHAGAIPLIMVHGWPGSFFEFDKVVDSLVNPTRPDDPAFHVVVPSLPGFCFSGRPSRRGWTMQDDARVLNTLMIQLGYTSYAAQAGDWGSFVAREMGARFPECKAVHLNFCPTPMPANIPVSEYTPREQKIEERCQDWLDNHLGYAVCMRTRPQTIGAALADNPIGILSWVGEKYLELADPDFLSNHREDWDEVILTQAYLYYFSDCILTSTLPYYENVRHAEFGSFFLKPENRINVPFGYTSFLYDSRPSTRRAVELTGNLVYYNECDTGGHFAALERPDILLEDCRIMFGKHFRF